jgi:hypothetical protein
LETDPASLRLPQQAPRVAVYKKLVRPFVSAFRWLWYVTFIGALFKRAFERIRCRYSEEEAAALDLASRLQPRASSLGSALAQTWPFSLLFSSTSSSGAAGNGTVRVGSLTTVRCAYCRARCVHQGVVLSSPFIAPFGMVSEGSISAASALSINPQLAQLAPCDVSLRSPWRVD